MSDSEKDLDEVNFGDQAFDCLIQGSGQAQSQGKQVSIMKDAKVETAINLNTINHYYKEMGTTMGKNKSEMQTQTPKVIRTDLEDDEYDDEDDLTNAVKTDLAESEVNGIDKFLDKVYDKLSKILDRNATSHIFDTYDVIWEDGAQDETEIRYKLKTDFDFGEANNATQKTLQKLKDAEKNQGSGAGGYADDDFDDDFNDYKQEIHGKSN